MYRSVTSLLLTIHKAPTVHFLHSFNSVNSSFCESSSFLFISFSSFFLPSLQLTVSRFLGIYFFFQQIQFAKVKWFAVPDKTIHISNGVCVYGKQRQRAFTYESCSFPLFFIAVFHVQCEECRIWEMERWCIASYLNIDIYFHFSCQFQFNIQLKWAQTCRADFTLQGIRKLMDAFLYPFLLWIWDAISTFILIQLFFRFVLFLFSVGPTSLE